MDVKGRQVIGSIVKWSPVPGQSGREFRVVDNFDQSEPKQFLCTSVDDDDRKCFTALQCDCTLVSEVQEKEAVKRERASEMPVTSQYTKETTDPAP